METIKHTSLLYSKAKYYERENKYEEAIATYESIIEHNDATIGLFIRLGELYESISLIDKAIVTYKKGISLAQKISNKKAERFLSYMLLGLLE